MKARWRGSKRSCVCWERGEAPLAESMKLFEEGTKLSAALGKLLDKAEQKVTVVQENLQGEVNERPFDAEEAAK